jgi:hypothetical protein
MVLKDAGAMSLTWWPLCAGACTQPAANEQTEEQAVQQVHDATAFRPV